MAEAAILEPSLEAVRVGQGTHAAAFSELNGEEQVRDVFGNVEVSFSQSALIFPDAQPVLNYLASIPAWHKLSAPEQERGRAALGQVLRPLLQDENWRVSKTLVFLSAQR